MAIARVNSSTVFASGSPTSTTIPVPAFNVATGNAVVAAFSLYHSGPTISSVTDNQGNSYALLGTLYGGDANHKAGVYLATNVVGSASLVVSANLSAAASFRIGVAVQYSGLASYDAGSTGKLEGSTSTAHTTNPVTTTAAG